MTKIFTVLMLTIIILSMTVKPIKPRGTYRGNFEWSSSILKLKSSGVFIQINNGCVHNIKNKGRWKVNMDTLELSIYKQQNLRSQEGWVNKEMTVKYIIRNDSLFGLYERDSINGNELNPYFSLTKRR
jgi:hypothetical protein